MKLLKKIKSNQTVRLTSLNSVSVLTRMLGGFLAAKMIAAFLGPAGMAITGYLRNYLTSIDTFSTLGMQNGIIKYTAENDSDKGKLSSVLSTVFFTMLAGVLLLGFVVALPADYWSKVVFNGTNHYNWVFRVLGIVIPFYAGSIVLVSMLNGLGCYNRVITINIIGNLLGVTMSALFIWYYKTDGALLGLILSPVIVFFLSMYPLYKAIGGLGSIKLAYFDFMLLKKMSSYSLMSFVSALLGPAIYIVLRNRITDISGVTGAGYWEGINRIASFYLMFATTLQTVYFLPMLAKAKTDIEVKQTWHSYYKIVVPVFAMGLVLVFILRKLVIKITLSDAFLPMEGLFLWQLVGDLFKISAQILAQEFFARRMVKQFLIFEIASFAVLYLSGYYLVGIFGVNGAVMSHAITYFVYLIVMVVYFRKKLF